VKGKKDPGELAVGVAEWAAALGRRGGLAKVATKGFGSLSPEERAANAAAAAAARWGKKRAKKKAAK
jgi:hypothetical protein